MTTNGRLVIGGKLTVIYSTVMFDWRYSRLTLLLVKRKTTTSDKVMTFKALTNIMSLLMILQFLLIFVAIAAGSAFGAIRLDWITMSGTKPRTQRLTALLFGENQFTEYQGGLVEGLFLDKAVLVWNHSVDDFSFDEY